ncbi:hypothetical protein AWE51_15400 [Aquimarina aggregata]|uniref:DUF2157 domain-containing protein n=1 Tax=Aquimarina aggregata TaxID=1642818 RepID=A0A163CTX7_9FLAO|nr:DUF2157 domain-containing protein [Aquimarina aggregata]KZS42757.1 hypothetical protein AWE51_15400 [Aquimarina aggregata]
MSSKFNKELQTLIKDKVISPELAQKIEQYYATKDIGKSTKLFTIFGVLGALLIGSGVILMLAHNWDDFTKLTKTILAFTPLLIGQVLTGFSILKKKSSTWKEASGTFLFFAIGACISLISQIYNIPGTLGSFLVTWILLCLPLIYLLRSHAIVLFCIIFSTYYAVEVGYWQYRNSETPWLYFVFMLAVIPYYLQVLKKSISSNMITILNWILPASIFTVLGTFIGHNGHLGFVMYITLFGLLYNIGKLPVFEKLRVFRNGFLVIGSLGSVISLLFFTFRWIWDESSSRFNFDLQGFYVSSALFMLSAITLSFVIWKKGLKKVNLFQVAFILFWGIYFLLFTVEILPVVLINILVFALGVSAIKIGADKFNFKILNYGLLIVSVLIVCRFFDTGMSFVLRGILFVIVGLGFFLTNYMMLKKQQKIKKQLNDLQV